MKPCYISSYLPLVAVLTRLWLSPWSDIDLDNSVVHITKTLNYKQEVNSPKSKASYRDIDIDQQTITMLKKYQRKQTQEALETR